MINEKEIIVKINHAILVGVATSLDRGNGIITGLDIEILAKDVWELVSNEIKESKKNGRKEQRN